MDMKQAVILYGRAAFDRKQGVAQLASAMAARDPSRSYHAAFEDLTGPSVPQVLDRLGEDGVTDVVLVSVATPADPTMSAWLPGALAARRQSRLAGGQPAMRVRIAPPVEAFVDLVAAIAAALAAPSDAVTDVADVTPSMGKPGWSDVPAHARQVFFCLGARCAHRRAQPLYQYLRQRMKQHRALNAGPLRVMCVRSGCLYPCNQGPLLIVHPDGVWYGQLDEAAIDRIISDHLLGGEPVADIRLR